MKNLKSSRQKMIQKNMTEIAKEKMKSSLQMENPPEKQEWNDKRKKRKSSLQMENHPERKEWTDKTKIWNLHGRKWSRKTWQKLQKKKWNLHCKWKILQKNRNEMIKEKSEIFTAENDPEKQEWNAKLKVWNLNCRKWSRKNGMKWVRNFRNLHCRKWSRKNGMNW